MSSSLKIDPTHTALLIMDYQTGIIASLPGDQAPLLQRVSPVLAAARESGLTVIYVMVAFRPGHPEIGQGNAMFTGLRQSGRFSTDDPNSGIHPAVAPQPGDIVVTKRRVSAFAGSDLELILRARGIDTLVLFGIATSGVVLSTVRQAADADYRLIVLADGCADRDEDVHRCLLDKVFPRQAEVITAAAFTQSLQAVH